MHTFTLEYWQDEGWYVGRLKLEENIRDAYQLMAETEPPPTSRPVLTRDIEA